MRPEDFLRAPLRYLECFADGRARLSAMPTFGLAHLVKRVRSDQLDGLDLRGWRTLIVGAERVRRRALRRFEALLGPAGFAPTALAPAYGLAEGTLAVTGPRTDRWRSAPLLDDPGVEVVGCGTPVLGAEVTIVDDQGVVVPDGTAGEIVVGGPSVAEGYLDPGAVAERGTRFVDGRLVSGDAGFVLDGELFVLGRLGDSLKLRGREVFAEELEAVLDRHGIPARRVAALLGHDRRHPDRGDPARGRRRRRSGRDRAYATERTARGRPADHPPGPGRHHRPDHEREAAPAGAVATLGGRRAQPRTVINR